MIGHAVKQALGVSFLIGTFVALGDSYVVAEFAKGLEVGKEGKKVGIEAAKGHAFMTLPIFVLGLGCWLA